MHKYAYYMQLALGDILTKPLELFERLLSFLEECDYNWFMSTFERGGCSLLMDLKESGNA